MTYSRNGRQYVVIAGGHGRGARAFCVSLFPKIFVYA